MPRTHYKSFMNKEYLGSWDLPDGKDIKATIQSAAQEKVIGSDGKKEDCFVIHFSDVAKPMIANITNCKMIEKLLGTPYIEEWVGHSVVIGIEKVRAFGDVVDALRVRPFLPAEKVITCEQCDNIIDAAFGMSSEKLAEYTKKKYGKCLCSNCATKANEDKGEDK